MFNLKRLEQGIMSSVDAWNKVRVDNGLTPLDTKRRQLIVNNSKGERYAINNSIFPSEDLFSLAKRIVTPKREKLRLRDFMPIEKFDPGTETVKYDILKEEVNKPRVQDTGETGFIPQVEISIDREEAQSQEYEIEISIKRKDVLQAQLAGKRNYNSYINVMERKLKLAIDTIKRREQEMALLGDGKIKGLFDSGNFGTNDDQSPTIASTVNFTSGTGEAIATTLSDARTKLDPNYAGNVMLIPHAVLRGLDLRMLATNDGRDILTWISETWAKSNNGVKLDIIPITELTNKLYIMDKHVENHALAAIEDITILPAVTDKQGTITQVVHMKSAGILRYHPKSMVEITNVA